MASFTNTWRLNANGEDLSYSKTSTEADGAVTSVDAAIGDGQTDTAVVFALDFSQCTAFYLVSDQDVTFETNNATTPDDTIALLANVPYIWTEDSYDTFLIGTDITTNVFVTNASGSTANIKIRALVDSTP